MSTFSTISSALYGGNICHYTGEIGGLLGGRVEAVMNGDSRSLQVTGHDDRAFLITPVDSSAGTRPVPCETMRYPPSDWVAVSDDEQRRVGQGNITYINVVGDRVSLTSSPGRYSESPPSRDDLHQEMLKWRGM